MSQPVRTSWLQAIAILTAIIVGWFLFSVWTYQDDPTVSSSALLH
jgi:hypothetical protein